MSRVFLDTSRLPRDVLMYNNKRFFDFIESFCGKDEADLLAIQAIRSVDSFLSVEDIYSIFTIDSEDVIEIQTRCAFKNRNGTFIVKPGIKSSLNYALSLLKEMKKETMKKKKNYLTSSSLIVSNASINADDISTDDSIINPSVSKKTEVAHKEHIIKSIEQWYSQNQREINALKINIVYDNDYQLKFSPSLEKAEIMCSCGLASSLSLGESGNFKVSLLDKPIESK